MKSQSSLEPSRQEAIVPRVQRLAPSFLAVDGGRSVYLPWALIVLLVVLGLVYGPIRQFDAYHAFADTREWFGIPYVGDVISNLPFLCVGVMVLFFWRSDHPALQYSLAGYRLFGVALMLTAIGSSYYHLAPDNARLVWDRIPIVLACVGLLAGVYGDCYQRKSSLILMILAPLSVMSVFYWYLGELQGRGDLRPYILFQVLPILLVPLWQWLFKRPKKECVAFASAILLYILAKLTEVYDHQILSVLQGLSGHTLKHLLAALGAALILWDVKRRIA